MEMKSLWGKLPWGEFIWALKNKVNSKYIILVIFIIIVLLIGMI